MYFFSYKSKFQCDLLTIIKAIKITSVYPVTLARNDRRRRQVAMNHLLSTYSTAYSSKEAVEVQRVSAG